MIKTEGALQEISKMRKVIIKKQKAITNLHLEKSYQRDEELVNDLIETYNNKMSNINNEEKDNSYLSFDDEDPILVLEQQLEKEILKYRKQLQVKAKEIQHQLENEKKRQNLQHNMTEREKKIEELQKKQHIKKKIKKYNQKLLHKKKKENQRNLLEDRQKQAEKFEKIRKKLEEYEFQQKKELEEQERKYQERRHIIQQRKLIQDKEYNQKLTSTMNQIEQKWAETSQNKDRQICKSKLEKLTMRSTLHEQKLRQYKLKTQQREDSLMQSIVKKLANKEEDLIALRQSKQKEEQIRIKAENEMKEN